MRNVLWAVLTVLCLRVLLTKAPPPDQPVDRKCSVGDCVIYGGPSAKYSIQLASKREESRSGGWIVGEIRAFAFGADNPVLIQNLAANGWVECAGQLIERRDFPEAAAMLEHTWGSQNVSRTQVFLPDFRGLVLRGWQHGRRAPEKHPFSPYTGDLDLDNRVFPRPELLDLPEPGIAGPTDSKTKDVIKDHVGSMQAEQFHGHRHSFSYMAANGVVEVPREQNGNAIAGGQPVRIGSSTGFEGGNETHPPNVYVFYLIYLGRPAYEVLQSAEDLRLARPKRVQAPRD
jgi:Phage Tail Collar Domain